MRNVIKPRADAPRNKASGKKQPYPQTRLARKLLRFAQPLALLVNNASAKLVPFQREDTSTPEALTRPLLVKGMWMMVFLFGVVGIWGAFYPLSTGAIAAGKVIVDSNRKEIQHLEGGIVKEILVKEGQKVGAGDTLIVLDDIAAEARSGLLRGQYIAVKAAEARLIAERDKADSITFPPELLAKETTEEEVRKALDAQRRLFASRRDSLQGRADVLQQKIKQSGNEIDGLRQQIASATQQISLLNEEISVVRQLLEKGNAVKPRLLALERQAAELQGQRGQAQAMISRANQTINEAKITILNLDTEFLSQVVAELKDTQVQVSNLSEQTSASDDVVRRITITSPIAGQVTAMKVTTIGGVIQPAQVLMTIVPLNEKLTIEARISPIDIDIVRPGLNAQVKISALDQRLVHPLEGEVITVSADRFEDPQRGEAYYLARIEIGEAELATLGKLQLSPGMPAEVLIVTGTRTMFSYLLRPITESFGRAFRQE
jgi:HlyD family type I secretion membrane fusion protein